MAERKSGTVESFHRGRGWGFIAPDGGVTRKDNVFVHYTSCPPVVNTFKTLFGGDRVEYEIGEGANGRLQALNVKLIKGSETRQDWLARGKK